MSPTALALPGVLSQSLSLNTTLSTFLLTSHGQSQELQSTHPAEDAHTLPTTHSRCTHADDNWVSSAAATKIKPSLMVCASSSIVRGLRLVAGGIRLQVEVDGLPQQQFPILTLALHGEKRSSRLRLFLGASMRSLVERLYHRGWKRFQDGTLLLVLSRTDSSRLAFEKCMVSVWGSVQEFFSNFSQVMEIRLTM